MISNGQRRFSGKHAVLLMICFYLFGCGTTMMVTPAIDTPPPPDLRIGGKIVYDGNREYLPRIIADEPGSGLVFTYSYNVAYWKSETPEAIPLFNPLTTFGFPIGENALIIQGKLDVQGERGINKSYVAMCRFKKTRSLFYEGDTFTEMRKQGLLAVRDSIEGQLCKDRDSLRSPKAE